MSLSFHFSSLVVHFMLFHSSFQRIFILLILNKKEMRQKGSFFAVKLSTFIKLNGTANQVKSLNLISKKELNLMQINSHNPFTEFHSYETPPNFQLSPMNEEEEEEDLIKFSLSTFSSIMTIISTFYQLAFSLNH